MTGSFLNHPEGRRLLRDGAWVVVLIGLLWSPLPEIVLGRWLQVANDARPETGRAHDRLDLLQESDSQTVSQSSVLEKQAEEVARVATLGQLRLYLMGHGELDMPLARFREFHRNLSPWQQEQILAPDALEELVSRGLGAVLVTRQGARARFAFLDGSRNRMDGVEADLLQLQLLPLGLGPVAEQDTALALADAAATLLADRDAEAELGPGPRELLGRLRKLPGVSVKRVWRSGDELLLIEIRAHGETQWLRPGSAPGGDGAWLARPAGREGRA